MDLLCSSCHLFDYPQDNEHFGSLMSGLNQAKLFVLVKIASKNPIAS